MEALGEYLAVLPQRYGGHLFISLLAIATGAAISFPLGMAVARRPELSGPALGFTSLVQTIPGLALLALMVPVLGGRIGFWPAYLALTLYSMLPILRNTIVGLESVSADVREAALGVGMTPLQRLWHVDLPLAAPIMVAGLRTAAVWVIGAATLSTPVGYESLGNYIFSGLQTRDWAMVLFGCVASAALALVLDQAIRLLQSGLTVRRRWPFGLAAGAFVLACLPAFLSIGPTSGRTSPAVSGLAAASSLEGQTITIGAKPFSEQYILAELLKTRLEAAGARVVVRENLGSTIAYDALRTGEIDVYVDYTGTVWATVMKRDAPVPRARMLAEMTAWLWEEDRILSLGALGFENAYAFAMHRPRAEALGVSSISDLVGGETALIKGGDVEFFARPEWQRVRDAYGLGDLKTRGMDNTFMYGAVVGGEVDVITAYTTDGRIDAFDLILLEDPLGALPPYDAVLLLSPEAADNDTLVRTLSPLLGAISGDQMRRANGLVDLEGETPGRAADALEMAIGE